MTDSRIEKSHAAIREAFLALLSEKHYNDITVREIAKRAGIGFRTFYRHYTDKDDLAQSIVADMTAFVDNMALSTDTLEATEANTITVLQHLQSNIEVVRIIRDNLALDNIIKATLPITSRRGGQIFSASLQGKSHDVPEELVSHHLGLSIIMLIYWWIKEDMKYPVEDMARYINKLVIRPIWNLK